MPGASKPSQFAHGADRGKGGSVAVCRAINFDEGLTEEEDDIWDHNKEEDDSAFKDGNNAEDDSAFEDGNSAFEGDDSAFDNGNSAFKEDDIALIQKKSVSLKIKEIEESKDPIN
eukprot:15365857-Ditylum_brightwellii.AAC.1